MNDDNVFRYFAPDPPASIPDGISAPFEIKTTSERVAERKARIAATEVCPCCSGKGRVVAAPVDGHGYTGPFTEREFLERAFDHEKTARNGMAAGPNVSYVRTFQACATALRMAAPLLPTPTVTE